MSVNQAEEENAEQKRKNPLRKKRVTTKKKMLSRGNKNAEQEGMNCSHLMTQHQMCIC